MKFKTNQTQLEGRVAQCFVTQDGDLTALLAARLEEMDIAHELQEMRDGQWKVTAALDARTFAPILAAAGRDTLEWFVWGEDEQTGTLREWGILFSRYLMWQQEALGVPMLHGVQWSQRRVFDLEDRSTFDRFAAFIGAWPGRWETFLRSHPKRSHPEQQKPRSLPPAI